MLPVLLVGFLSVAFFFRYQFLNRFSLLSGDHYDQVIELAILEHWFNTFQGLSHWSETGYFYPFSKTLGYNDGYFLYGILYSAFRSARLDPYLSGECVSVVVRLAGFFGFYLAMRRLLDLKPGWAILAAVLFTLSNNAFVQAHHAQLLSVSFVPIMAVLLDAMLAALLSGRSARVLLWGAAAACLYAAWLMTAYYMAWFFALFSTFAGLAYLVLTRCAGLRAGLGTARRHAAPLAAVALVFVLAVLPFLSVYVPKAQETGMHPYRAARSNTLSLPDLLELGSGNLLYGRADALMDHAIRPAYPAWTERMTGFPPALLFLFACGVVLLFAAPPALSPARTTVLRSLAVAALATWALTFNLDGHSPWWFIYGFFPGAKAARVVARYQIFVAAPVTAIAVLYLSASARRIAAPVLGLVCVLLVAEQINAAPHLALDRAHELARLGAVPPPPAECSAFFTSSARPEPMLDAGWDGFYSHNVDAMIIAEVIHLPTINGASTFQPPRWNLTDPDRPDYLDRVRQYAAANHVSQLCSLDLKTMTWGRLPLSADPVAHQAPAARKMPPKAG